MVLNAIVSPESKKESTYRACVERFEPIYFQFNCGARTFFLIKSVSILDVETMDRGYFGT